MANDDWRDDDRQRWNQDRERYAHDDGGDTNRSGSERGSRDTSREQYGRERSGRDVHRDDQGRDWDRSGTSGSGGGYNRGRAYGAGSYGGYGYGGPNYDDRSRDRDWGASSARSESGSDADRYGGDRDRYSHSGQYGSGQRDYQQSDYPGSGYRSQDYGQRGYGQSHGRPGRGQSSYALRQARDYGRSDYSRSDFSRSDYGRSDRGRDYGRSAQERSNDERSSYQRPSDVQPEFSYLSGAYWSAGLSEWPAPIEDYRSGYRNDWRRTSGEYRGADSRGDHDWRSGGSNDRGWWDRTKDEVRSWMGDEEAERRRRADAFDDGSYRPGSTGRTHYGRGPKGYARSDQRILEDISDRLTADWYVDASEIELTVTNGDVTLTGTVDTRDTKRRAENIAADVSGVKDVHNSLRVRQPLSQRDNLTGSSSAALEQTTGSSTGTPPTVTATTSGTTNAPSGNAGNATRPKH